jgi:hypothetical protein
MGGVGGASGICIAQHIVKRREKSLHVLLFPFPPADWKAGRLRETLGTSIAAVVLT